jgi:hypothetical protein
MTITIRTNPEIVIEVESIKEEKKFERRIVVPDGKIAPDVKSEPVANIKKGKGLGISRSAERPVIVLTNVRRVEVPL